MQNEFIPKKGTSYAEIKPHLSDNFDKPVYYHLQFAPKNKRNYSSEQLDEATHPSKYLGLETFAHTELDRRANVAIFETVLEVSFYYCPNYPHGCMYHLDWNDSHVLAVYQKAQASLIELASLLFELGYAHATSIRSERRGWKNKTLTNQTQKTHSERYSEQPNPTHARIKALHPCHWGSKGHIETFAWQAIRPLVWLGYQRVQRTGLGLCAFFVLTYCAGLKIVVSLRRKKYKLFSLFLFVVW